MMMASQSTSKAGSATPSDPALSCRGGIETLNLKVGPVRRNLFGPVDHQQLQQDFQKLLCMSVEVANKRWNFDFQTDMPGEGSNIEWEELQRQNVPAFYQSCMVRPVVRPVVRPAVQPAVRPVVRHGLRAKKGIRWTSFSSGEASPMSSSSSGSGSGDEYVEVATRGCFTLRQPGKRRQSAITDFFKVKKTKLLHYKSSSSSRR